jgi:mRNA-degrading endonuclease RelE of RelBE toxin-antitoxin system
MKSSTLPSFWTAYKSLDKRIQASARKAYLLWRENPFHPSLHFKCINRDENVWSVRVTRGYRAVGTFDGNTVTWFWIGGHNDYDRFFS